MTRGIIFNIQKYSVQDGPGIRTTVFLKGCPLHCWWCHNPESQARQPEVIVLENRCLRCGACLEVCPAGTFVMRDGDLRRGDGVCQVCGACTVACPTGARQIVGREMTVEEVMSEVLKDRLFYDESKGGLTVSGGEPLQQPRFLRDLLAAARNEGIHTAVDTCGFGAQEDLLAIAPLTDLFLYDLKAMDEASHVLHTGVSNRPILDNLRALGEVHDHIWVRIPVIPGLNDDSTELEAMARFVAANRGVRQVNLLPYHRTGLAKLRRLGRSSRMEQTPAPGLVDLKPLLKTFNAYGLIARAGG